MSDPTRAFPVGAPAGGFGDPLSRYPQIRELRSQLNRRLISALIFSAAGFLILASGWFYGMLTWVPQLAPSAEGAAAVREFAGAGAVPLLVWIGIHGLLILLGAVGFRARAALQSLRSGQAYRALPAGEFARVLIILYLLALGIGIIAGLALAALVLAAGPVTLTEVSGQAVSMEHQQVWRAVAVIAGGLCVSMVLLFVSQIINYRGQRTAIQLENTVRQVSGGQW